MTPTDLWNATYHQLESQVDRNSFDMWLRGAVFLRYEDGVYYIGVTKWQTRDMLQERYHKTIRHVIHNLTGSEDDVVFEVYRSLDSGQDAEVETDERPLFKFLARSQKATTDEPAPALRELLQTPRLPALPESELNSDFTFARYIISQSNSMVYEAARAVAEYPGTVYNPLLMYGGVGLGKTHLLQAIAHDCVQRGLNALYVPSEVFTNDLIKAIRERTTAMFREKYRTADVLLMDDIQFIRGKESTQEEFFHTFNAMVNYNKQIVLVSDRHPDELKTLEDRLRSRFLGGLVLDVPVPQLETRMAILKMWADERGRDAASE